MILTDTCIRYIRYNMAAAYEYNRKIYEILISENVKVSELQYGICSTNADYLSNKQVKEILRIVQEHKDSEYLKVKNRIDTQNTLHDSHIETTKNAFVIPKAVLNPASIDRLNQETKFSSPIAPVGKTGALAKKNKSPLYGPYSVKGCVKYCTVNVH